MKFFTNFLVWISLIIIAVTNTSLASAHVVVKPDTAQVAKYQTFTISVPNEKDIATSQVRLVIPDGLNNVTPNVKRGWQINIVKDQNKVAEIIWKAGTIPAGQRDEFAFNAQAPAEETAVAWKSYQTYESGTVVAWDKNPSEVSHEDESEESGPFSVTKIVNDLNQMQTTNTQSALPLMLSIAALAVAIASLGMQLFKQS